MTRLVGLVLAALVAGCAARSSHRVQTPTGWALVPARPRAATIGGSAVDVPDGIEADLHRALARRLGRVLWPDVRLHQLAETLFDEVTPELEMPEQDLVDEVAHWHGIPERAGDTIKLHAFTAGVDTELIDYAAEELARDLRDTDFDRIAIVIRTAPGPRRWVRKAVVATSSRPYEMEPVPAVLGRNQPLLLSVTLRPPFERPQVYLTRPDGSRVLESARPRGRDLFVRLLPDLPGRWQVELFGTSQDGPHVLANFPVWVASRPPRSLPISTSSTSSQSADTAAAVLLRRIGEERRRRGLPPLERLPVLERVAAQYSREMHDGHFFAHWSPRSGNAGDRMASAGFDAHHWSENITGGRDADAMHEGFMHSPGHASSILDPEMTHVGVGVFAWGSGRDRRYLATELFVRIEPPSP